MRKLVLVILIVLFSAIYYFSSGGSSDAVKNSVSSFSGLIKKTTTALPVLANAALENPAEILPVKESEQGLGALAPEALKKWLSDESGWLNSTQNNTEDQQIRFQAQAQTLMPAQLQVLRDFALDSTGPINDRILSAYMITLNTSPESQGTLFEVAKSDLPDHGPILPHSEAELKHTQELALRYMEIDELFERSKTDANARDKLKLLVLEAQSAQVRSYAEKKLKQVK